MTCPSTDCPNPEAQHPILNDLQEVLCPCASYWTNLTDSNTTPATGWD